MKKFIVCVMIYYVIAIIILHLLDWCTIGCPNCGYKGCYYTFCPHCGYEVTDNENSYDCIVNIK